MPGKPSSMRPSSTSTIISFFMMLWEYRGKTPARTDASYRRSQSSLIGSEHWLVPCFPRPGPALSQVAGRLGGKDPLPPGFEFLHPPLPIAQLLSAMGEAQLQEDFVGTDFFAGGDVLANLVRRTHENRADFLHRLIPEDQVAAHYHL